MSAVIPINLVILVGFFLMHLFRDIVFEVWIIQGSFCSEQTMQDQSNQWCLVACHDSDSLINAIYN